MTSQAAPDGRPDSVDGSPSEEDLNLVREVRTGSIEAWHRFLGSYSGLVFGVIRRHLFTADEDDVRTVYVDVLKRLYDGDMDRYEGRSRLSTWLIVYAKARALDRVRHQHGRFRDPKGLDRLEPIDREVLRLYFAEKLSLEIVIHTLRWSGYAVSAETIVESIERIEERLDRRFLRRLDNEFLARRNGARSVRLLEYLVHLGQENEEGVWRNAADRRVEEREALEMADRARALLAELPDEDRRILELRFHKGWTAKRIAGNLGLEGPRRVYTIVERALRRLRVLMKEMEL